MKNQTPDATAIETNDSMPSHNPVLFLSDPAFYLIALSTLLKERDTPFKLHAFMEAREFMDGKNAIDRRLNFVYPIILN